MDSDGMQKAKAMERLTSLPDYQVYEKELQDLLFHAIRKLVATPANDHPALIQAQSHIAVLAKILELPDGVIVSAAVEKNLTVTRRGWWRRMWDAWKEV